MNKLTDNELNSIVDTAAEAREDSDAIDMLKLKEEEEMKKELDSLEQEELQSDVKNVDIKGNEMPDIITTKVETMPTADVSLFDLDGDQIVKSKEENDAIAETIANNAKDSLNLSDEETMDMISLISDIKTNPDCVVYSRLPEQLKKLVRDLAVQNGIPHTQYNNMARVIMKEFISDSEFEAMFIDLEKALNESLNIPSIIDLYTEHTTKVMKENIPKMIEEIKDIDPEKAETLSKVRDAFDRSYTFSFAKEEYESNSRLRKCVRKPEQWFKKSLDEFNFRNEKTNFKMNDVTELPKVLNFILVEQPAHSVLDIDEINERVQKLKDMNITESDIEKFCILICKSCENLNPKDVIDAAYMYYMMKNIIVLKHTSEAKTEFAAELINNICDTISFIRNKEEEFNAANLDKPKRRA